MRRADGAFEADKSSAANEQDVGGIDRGEFLVRMLASTLRRHVGDRAFEDLQQRLLHAFTGNVAGDGGVLVLAANLVDLVDVDDAGLGATDVAVRGLQQLEDDVLDVLADVAGFGESRGIDDGERNIEHLGQGLGQQASYLYP